MIQGCVTSQKMTQSVHSGTFSLNKIFYSKKTSKIKILEKNPVEIAEFCRELFRLKHQKNEFFFEEKSKQKLTIITVQSIDHPFIDIFGKITNLLC